MKDLYLLKRLRSTLDQSNINVDLNNVYFISTLAFEGYACAGLCGIIKAMHVFEMITYSESQVLLELIRHGYKKYFAPPRAFDFWFYAETAVENKKLRLEFLDKLIEDEQIRITETA